MSFTSLLLWKLEANQKLLAKVVHTLDDVIVTQRRVNGDVLQLLLKYVQGGASAASVKNTVSPEVECDWSTSAKRENMSCDWLKRVKKNLVNNFLYWQL